MPGGVQLDDAQPRRLHRLTPVARQHTCAPRHLRATSPWRCVSGSSHLQVPVGDLVDLLDLADVLERVDVMRKLLKWRPLCISGSTRRAG
jgi:hypothetical protein